jgi:hypothetical protein
VLYIFICTFFTWNEKTNDSEMNGSSHFFCLVYSSFLRRCKFNFVPWFPNIWTSPHFLTIYSHVKLLVRECVHLTTQIFSVNNNNYHLKLWKPQQYYVLHRKEKGQIFANMVKLGYGIRGGGGGNDVVQPWKWRQHVSPKHWHPPTSPGGFTTRKNNIEISAAANTSNLT